jgi:ankyrin repeat protein
MKEKLLYWLLLDMVDSLFSSSILIKYPSGTASTVRCLISLGSDVYITNKDEETCLHCACKRGKLEVVKAILEKNSDLTKGIPK